MKTIIDRASSRGYANHGWLQTYHSFSFANYYNPEKINFGALRVLNDDTVAPNEGFDTHPHRNMEVISIPLSGYLRHGDSIQNSEVITRGQIQLMSTGTGILHSEFNDSSTDPVQFLQIWVIPSKNNTTPKYENHDIRPLLKQGEISTFIAPDSPISILQDAWFSWGDLAQHSDRTYTLKGKDTGVYLFVIEGEVDVEGHHLKRRDAIGITDTKSIEIKATENSVFLVIEVSMK